MDFETGDIVTIGKAKTEYEITHDLDQVVNLRALVSGRAQRYIPKAKLTHVARFKTLKDAEKAQTEADNAHIEHIPGESPAEYKARTGRKLDGRTTIYGRMILVGLQLKRTVVGKTGGTAKNRKAAKRAARTKR